MGAVQQKMPLLTQENKYLEGSLPKGWYPLTFLPIPTHTHKSIINSKGGGSVDDSLSMLILEGWHRQTWLEESFAGFNQLLGSSNVITESHKNPSERSIRHLRGKNNSLFCLATDGGHSVFYVCKTHFIHYLHVLVSWANVQNILKPFALLRKT